MRGALPPIPASDYRERFQEEDQVGAEAPVGDVLEVEGHVGVEGGVAASGDLPEASDAGLHVQAAEMLNVVALVIVEGMRAGANEAHLSLEDVDELGQLVEAEFAEPAAGAGDAGIFLHFEEGTLAFVGCAQLLFAALGVHDHAAELVADEGNAFLADALGAVEDFAGGVQANDQGDDKEERRENEQGGGGEDDVHDALDEEAESRNGLAVQFDHRKGTDEAEGSVPGEAFVHFGDQADVEVQAARLFGDAIDEVAIGGHGEKDFVNEFGAGDLGQILNLAEQATIGVRGGVEEANETIAELLILVEEEGQLLADFASADDQDIAHGKALLDAANDELPLPDAPTGQKRHVQESADANNFAGNDLDVRAENEGGEHKGGHADAAQDFASFLEGQALPGRAVEILTLEEKHDQYGVEEKKSQVGLEREIQADRELAGKERPGSEEVQEAKAKCQGAAKADQEQVNEGVAGVHPGAVHCRKQIVFGVGAVAGHLAGHLIDSRRCRRGKLWDARFLRSRRTART